MRLEQIRTLRWAIACFTLASWGGVAQAEQVTPMRPANPDGLQQVAVAVQAVDLVPPAGIIGEDWRAIGTGELRWFGFRVYRAALWASRPVVVAQDGDFALVLRYQRSISSARLVQASVDEMLRLGVADAAQIARWQPLLEQAFPDVEAGDQITGVNRAGRGAAFYFGDARTAQIDDPAFAHAFFAIWLDERTREPGLRARLTGQPLDG